MKANYFRFLKIEFYLSRENPSSDFISSILYLIHFTNPNEDFLLMAIEVIDFLYNFDQSSYDFQ